MSDHDLKPIGFIFFLMIAAAVLGFMKWILFSQQKDRIFADEMARVEQAANGKDDSRSIIRDVKNIWEHHYGRISEDHSTIAVILNYSQETPAANQPGLNPKMEGEELDQPSPSESRSTN